MAQPTCEVDGVLVGLGLREGYDTAAPTHSVREVADRLRAGSTSGWRCRTARLVSARVVDGAVRWYEETGVLVRAQDHLLAAIESAAAHCSQDQCVVTHLSQGRTYALRRIPRPVC